MTDTFARLLWASVLTVFGCSNPTTAPALAGAPPIVADLAGDYTLTAIAFIASQPQAPLPPWTFPGRVLVLEGHLSLRTDGVAITSGRSRLTLFNDTTYNAGTDTAKWAISAVGTIDFTTSRKLPEDQGRATGRVVEVFAGGLTSGGTVFRYERP
jgi:hypothetical protein